MSLTLKISSLVIRTLSKPIANQIKSQAREHERFRRVCVSVAQGLHQLDMRLRLGNIRDTTASQKRAAAEAEARKHLPTSPTVKTEAETKAQEAAIAKAKAVAEETVKPAPKPHIRPLSESKAIESGATFISEAFLFLVAGGLIVFESWRSRRKETTRREDVEARLVELEQSEKNSRRALLLLEKELLHLKAKHGEWSKSTTRILPKEIREVEELDEVEEAKDQGWWSVITSYLSFGQNTDQEAMPPSTENKDTASKSPVPAQSPVSQVIPGDRPKPETKNH